MRISLLLCLFLTVTVSVFSVLANQSDPFKQNGSDTPKEIKTDMVEAEVKTNKMSSARCVFYGANIASAVTSLVAGAVMFADGAGVLGSLIIFPGLALTVASTTLVDTEKEPDKSNGFATLNAVRFFFNGAFGIAYIIQDR